jgi:hypothetical protein
MHINPFLLSVAAPAAIKTAHAVSGAAQDLGQAFLNIFVPNEETAAVTDMQQGNSLEAQLQETARGFRRWLVSNGVQGGFEMQFEVDDVGEPTANVVGRDSAKIVDLLFNSSDWLSKLTNLSDAAKSEFADQAISGGRLRLAISSQDASWVAQPSQRVIF